jgi:hypothetical protein
MGTEWALITGYASQPNLLLEIIRPCGKESVQHGVEATIEQR